jgi:hypothetical protein
MYSASTEDCVERCTPRRAVMVSSIESPKVGNCNDVVEVIHKSCFSVSWKVEGMWRPSSLEGVSEQKSCKP